VGDALLRRTRLGLTAARPLLADGAPDRVAAAIGAELGWNPARVGAEAEGFRREAAAEGIVVA
jgi:glycerol-3-phosphate dehydrogenase